MPLSRPVSALENARHAHPGSFLTRGYRVLMLQQAFDETARRVKAEEDSDAESSGVEEAKIALMNPTLFNAARLRKASIPAANGHFNARSSPAPPTPISL
eukprot:292261-Rhodomonas_salina.2